MQGEGLLDMESDYKVLRLLALLAIHSPNHSGFFDRLGVLPLSKSSYEVS